ncbi:hypothetical protein M406DRAFT_281813 [Cryphonectria parasitica EP155]|uniref:Mediator of RNA polymerase II transcription subunit 13 n=1 Tax=Cryphonectria parasitica (strain ATCC 38755 / EP155) TaxID=660469 RepID=A0A9P4XVL8_CRYP1|nr:uncharacterized protein M406DRAFT_281813 [Cryphonectria parasitica EP155]KAF3761746.1 hypothetical protein M406DRAFT_281813 [Cryphonectria parasitica EP155]
MDPGEYETNTLLINNVSSVAFKIYEPAPPSSSPYTFAASDVESALRNEGHLVYADPLRRAIWCFWLGRGDESPLGDLSPGANLHACGHNLAMVEEGMLEPVSLFKNRIMTPNAMSTPSSSSPSGSGVDMGLRPPTTPGGIMTSGGLASEADVKSSFGYTVDLKSYGAISPKDIHEYFVASVLGSLSHRFCSKTGAIPLDSKSFILPSEGGFADHESSQTPAPSIFASLRVHLTTTGSLLIGISLTVVEGIWAGSDGLSAPPHMSGSTVLAAPLGMFGTLPASSDVDQYSVDGSIAQSPDTQVTRYRADVDGRSSHWRSTCCKLLEMRGISSATLSKSSWINIQFLRRKPNELRTDGKRTPMVNPHAQLMWPAALCYRKRTRKPVIIQNSFELGHASAKDEFDALKSAQHWFLNNTEREDLLSTRKKEREAATSSKESGETDSRLLHSGLSPNAPRRTSNPGAAGGTMYPTPPDGVQNATGITPTIDGTTSSPGNPVPSTAMVDIDTSMTVPGGLTDAFGDAWEGSEIKREQSFNQENWDLNNDVFVDNDITDADFNFFDDENPTGMDANISELPDMDTGPSNIDSSQPPSIPEPQQPPPQQDPIKIEPPSAQPVFAKPELKHARSILERNRDHAKAGPSNGIKRHPSPFDPATVYKKLKLSLAPSISPITSSTRRGSAFDKLDFDRSFAAVNKKYEHNGRFDFREEEQTSDTPPRTGSPPTTGYLQRHGKARTTLKELPANLGSQVAGMAAAVNSRMTASEAAHADESTSDADDISLVSDQDDMSDFSDEPSSPTKASIQRRRFADDNESVAASTRDFEAMDELAFNADLSKLSISNSPESTVARYFADPEPIMPRVPLSDEEYIMVAQILTEQAVSGCLNYALNGLMHTGLDLSRPQRKMMRGLRSSVHALQTILPPCLQSATTCQLRQLVDTQDVPLLAAPSRIQPRPPGGGPEQRPSLVQIAPPHLELRRYETKLSVLPSAVNFWESLGLGPSQGSKDVHSVCVFPNLDGMADSAGIFLDRLSNVYESLKLGSFDRMPSSPNVPNGLLPFEVDKTTNAPTTSQGSRSGQPLVDDMAKLAVAIFNTTSVSKNFVVFFVYTPENPGTIVESCLAFQRMFELYRRALTERKKPAQNELVLQLVPLNFVGTPTSMVVLSPGDCIRICLEVYDRCTLFGGPMPSPAIVLEQQPVTSGISFQLRNPPSPNVLQENSVMHIAYAQSVDDRWITTAWTDNRGCKQMTASYCLGRKGRPLSRSFADIAHEIWATTHDLTSIWKVHWRIVITKIGVMDPAEINEWITLAQKESKSSFSLVLLTVDTNPSLQLVPSVPKTSMAGQATFYSTPVSTPQPATMSPEAVGNPSTPKGAPTSTNVSTPVADNNAVEADTDATLVDVSDTTWGAVLSHRLNTSCSLTDPTPALISGYLIRRGGLRADDPPTVMEVNVIHCEGNPRVLELLLREMLSVFRGLGTIARARSVTEKEGDVRPWHVAAVEKGLRALYQLM